MGYILTIIIFLATILSTQFYNIDAMLTSEQNQKAKSGTKEIEVNQAVKRVETVFVKNYDYLNLPLSLIPDGGLTETKSSLSIYIEALEGVKKNTDENEIVMINANRVCVYNLKTDKHRCSSNDGGALDSIEYEKAKSSIQEILTAIGDRVYVHFEPLDFTYNKTLFPSLKMIVYQTKAGGYPDGVSTSYEITLNDRINEMIIASKHIMDKMYDRYGEQTKRDFKGYVKTDIVSQTNPVAVIGDGIDTTLSNTVKYTPPVRVGVAPPPINDDTGFIEHSTPYISLGDTALKGWGTSNSIVMPFKFLSDNYSSKIPAHGCKVVEADFKPSTISDPQFSHRHYYVCGNPKEMYQRFCESDDEFCKMNIRDDLQVENFCLSSEPCYVEYELNEKNTIEKIKSNSGDFLFKKRYNMGIDRYDNPFYPNYRDTLYPEEQKGLIISGNNQGIPAKGGKYYFILGMKYIPVHFKTKAEEKQDNYIINKYTIQGR